MLAPQIEADGTDPMLRLGIDARDYYLPLAASLRETTGIDIGLWQEGIARVAGGDDEAGELRVKVASQQQQGYSATWLEAGQVRSRWPWLGPTAGALWSERDGALDPALLVEALLADARRQGAELVSDRVIAVEQTGGRVSGVTG
jgi:glycine/D-amino acid oxidase-like deaminating enzyme